LVQSTQAQINELRRDLEKQRVSHKLLKAKVTHLAARLRTIEPFTYAEDRELFRIYVQDFLREKERVVRRCQC
jgi:vacuolar-type H+-ATPase subunit D/Vma8